MSYRPMGYNGWEEYLMAQRRRESARWVVNAIKVGTIPHPSTCKCVDCGKPARK